MRPGHQRVCAVCARVLDFHEDLNDPDYERWDHSYQDQEAGVDHLPVPVLPEEIIPRYRCDFCNEDSTAPGWVIPSNDFPMPGGAQPGASLNMSTGDWAACDACEAFIAADDWSGLLSRVTTGSAMRSAMPAEFLRVQLARMYHRLRANITGEPFRVVGNQPKGNT